MKKLFLLIILCSSIQFVSHAQKIFNSNTFKIDNFVCVQNHSNQFNKSVSYYSELWGGKRIAKENNNALGKCNRYFASDEVPAMVLCGGIVVYTEEIEFEINNLNINTLGNQAHITFDASSRINDKIQFQLIKIVNQNETLLASYTCDLANVSQSFSYIDNPINQLNDANYFLRANHMTAGVRYEQPLILPSLRGIANANIPSSFKLFPSVTTGKIFTEYSNDYKGTNYHIYDMNGKILMNGILNEFQTEINVSQLPQGNYLFTMSGKTETYKFIKQ